MMTSTMQKDAKNIGVWINKCGGKRKFAVEEGVNVAIIEMARISSIIHSFISWRLKHYQKHYSTDASQMDPSTVIPEVDEESDSESEVEIQHHLSAFREVVRRNETRPVVPRSKREQKLLAHPQQATIGTKKRPTVGQLAVLKQSTLESMFSRQFIAQGSRI